MAYIQIIDNKVAKNYRVETVLPANDHSRGSGRRCSRDERKSKKRNGDGLTRGRRAQMITEIDTDKGNNASVGPEGVKALPPP